MNADVNVAIARLPCVLYQLAKTKPYHGGILVIHAPSVLDLFASLSFCPVIHSLRYNIMWFVFSCMYCKVSHVQ